ncbi:MAG: hypothetical protein KA419_11670 [Acidobacteria bacterium]|nr:hypothetical protein [Acidobacteriota bacterium]
MVRKFRPALLLLSFCGTFALAQVGVWQNHGPNPGTTTRLAVAPNGYDGLFAGQYQDGGCLSATKDGSGNIVWQTWRDSLSNPNVIDVAAAVGDGQQILWAATTSYLFRSLDRGQTWSSQTPELAYFMRVESAIAVGAPDSILYACTTAGKVWKTSDGGATWTDCTGTLPGNPIHSLEVSSQFPTSLFVGHYQGSIHVTYNSGGTWTKVRDGAGDGRVSALAILDPLPQAEQYHVLAAYAETTTGTNPGPGMAIYKTVDGGDHWNKVFSLASVECLAKDPEDGNVVYAGTRAHDGASAVYKSTDRGNTWTPCGKDFGEDVGVSSLVVVPSTHPLPGVYAGTYDGSILRSTDGGLHWKWEPRGLSNRSVRGLAASDAGLKRLYAGTDYGECFGSLSLGWTWGLMNFGANDLLLGNKIYDLAVEPGSASPVLYAAARNLQLVRSPNGGISWEPAPLPDQSVNVWTVAFAPGDPDMVYAAGGQIFNGPSFFTSEDKGQTWAQRSLNCWGNDLAVSPVHPGNVFVGSSASYPSYGVYGSQDRGASWPTNLRGLQGIDVLAVAVKPGGGQVVYAGTDGHGLFRTTDGGASWSSWGFNGKTVAGIAVHPFWTNQMLAGVPGEGVYRSTDGGGTWFLSSTGIWDKDILEVLYHPASPAWAFASTDGGGVFFRKIVLDLNLDDLFDVIDLVDFGDLLAERRHTVPGGFGAADLNGDGVENAVDLVLMCVTPMDLTQ